MLGSLAHLMYGSCQSSKWHYIVQCYYIQEYLPSWMLANNNPVILGKLDKGTIKVYSNFSGIWKTWHSNGNMEYKIEYQNGSLNGKYERWFDNRNKDFSCYFVNDIIKGNFANWHSNGKIKNSGKFHGAKEEGRHEKWYSNGGKLSAGYWKKGKRIGNHKSWYSNGNKESNEIFKNNIRASKEEWNKDGSINKKEYYDPQRQLPKERAL